MLQIVPYLPEHAPYFESLNRRWIELHFGMEPMDELVLTRPDEHILAPGGKILMALWDGQVAGTVAIRPADDGRPEMTKMAVDPAFQGKKIGEALVRASIETAKEMGARRLVLYSSTVLQNAIHLYRKTGFTETLIREMRYKRGDIKMEIPLCDFNTNERNELLDNYRRVPEDIREALHGFPKEMWHWRESPERWSIHEMLLHLADSEANSYIRCRRILAEPGSLLSAYDENRWAKTLTYENRDAEEALELFTVLRRNTHRLLLTLPEDAWRRKAVHETNGETSLDDWLWIYANHTHIGQMRRLYRNYLSRP